MSREFDAESGSHQTASSAIEFDMFPYIMEKRRNRRAGRDSRAAVDAENATGGG
jgi:hypothetical protein